MNKNGKPQDKEPSCVDPSVGEKVYDYYNGALRGPDIRKFEIHLITCAYCEKVILDLDFSLSAVNSDSNLDSTCASEVARDPSSAKK